MQGRSWRVGAPSAATSPPGEPQHAQHTGLALARSRDAAYELVEEGLPRREFLRRAALLTGATALGARAVWSGDRARSASVPRVAIVGAGLAGLSAAHHIHAARPTWDLAVFDVRSRVGGRVHTIRGLSAGQYAEAGGGGISTGDHDIQVLARQLGLWPLEDTWRHYAGGPETFRFNGHDYTRDQLMPGTHDIHAQGWLRWRQIGSRIPSYDNHNAAAAQLDQMSVRDYLGQIGHDPASDPAGAYWDAWFGGEYGASADRASALHLILEEGTFWPDEGDYERYAIPGGNDILPRMLSAGLPRGTVQLHSQLVALARRSDGRYRLTFDRNGSTTDVIADRVVLALPPTALRDADLTNAGFSALKQTQITQEDLGNTAKFNIQFAQRPWAAAGRSGDAVTDLIPQESWSEQFFPSGPEPAVLIFLNNRDYGAAPAHGRAPTDVLNAALADLDVLWPGSTAAAIRKHAYLEYWPADPWAKGSYSFLPPGGFTLFFGAEASSQGGVTFAGEHTADYAERGTMNGAVASGLRAAREALRHG